MWSFPTLEPAIVEDSVFLVERLLPRPGRVEVGVGDIVTPETIVARSDKAEKTITLFVANEIGTPNDKFQRHLTKPVGSVFEQGEVIARRRNGLRTATIAAPMAGTLASIDSATGTAQLVVSSASGELRALVNGDVERIVPDRGALIRASGSRVFGILGFGAETVGRITVGLDRGDRELTADQVKDTWRGAIVLTGMTVGVSALQRLRQVGVAGIIVGSIAEADARRFLGQSAESGELSAARFWQPGRPGTPFAQSGERAPFAIMVTEGFGRIPIAEPVFAFLRKHEGELASLRPLTAVGEGLSRPEVYITGAGVAHESDARTTDELRPGRAVRVLAGQLGAVGVVTSEPFERIGLDGSREFVVGVQHGADELVLAASNLEVLS